MQDRYKIVQGDFIDSHVNLKMLHDWLVIREYLLTLNTCGLYRIEHFRAACEAGSINYNTARGRIGWYEQQGLVVRNKKKGVIKLVQLTIKVGRLEKLFVRARDAIRAAKNPRMYFADLWKKKLIYDNVFAQAIKESEQCQDRNSDRKLLRAVRGGKTPIGVKQGIYLSMSTIGRILSRTKGTAWKHIERMNSTEILSRKKYLAYVCPVAEIEQHRRTFELYGRLTTKNGSVFERLQNSYFF